MVVRPRRAERVPQPSTLRRIKTHTRLSPASIAGPAEIFPRPQRNSSGGRNGELAGVPVHDLAVATTNEAAHHTALGPHRFKEFFRD